VIRHVRYQNSILEHVLGLGGSAAIMVLPLADHADRQLLRRVFVIVLEEGARP
jgi:hypothetical protein